MKRAEVAVVNGAAADMVSKKEILAAPYVKKAFFDACWETFEGPLDIVVENLKKYAADKDNVKISIEYNYDYEHTVEYPRFNWDVPMTEAEIATEKHRRELQIKEIDLRRNRTKLIEKIKATKDVTEALTMIAEDPELASRMIESLR